jgi:hypothetical protein
VKITYRQLYRAMQKSIELNADHEQALDRLVAVEGQAIRYARRKRGDPVSDSDLEDVQIQLQEAEDAFEAEIDWETI